MIHGSGSGYWIQFEKLHFWGMKGGSAYSQRKADPIVFGAKTAPNCGEWIQVLGTQLLDLVI